MSLAPVGGGTAEADTLTWQALGYPPAASPAERWDLEKPFTVDCGHKKGPQRLTTGAIQINVAAIAELGRIVNHLLH